MQKIKYISRFILFISIMTAIVFISCHKNRIYTSDDAKLNFSEEILTFDTVFTTIGSITKVLKVSNPHKNTIKTDIGLVGGNISNFSVNVNGVSGSYFKDVEIHSKDSIFIFIKVNLNPNGQNQPILIVDTLAFFTNGNRQNVELLACGEDAHFIVPDVVLKDQNGAVMINYKVIAHERENIIWDNDKPYVIYGYAAIDSLAKLTIKAGTQIYLHKGAGLWVYSGGNIQVEGTKEEPVVFQGDRRNLADEKDLAQWDRIWICEGKDDNKIEYAIIKNAFIGIQAEILTKDMGNKLILKNTIIKNSQGYGLLGRGYRIDAFNNIISNCGNYCLSLVQGGIYNFINNTVYNQYSYSTRTTPAVYFSNVYYPSVVSAGIASDFYCNFINNIVYGVQPNEFNLLTVSATKFELYVENCLIKTDQSILDNVTAHSDVILNQDPMLVNILENNFALLNNSPCKGKGKIVPQPQEDIIGAPRDAPPSIGAHE